MKSIGQESQRSATCSKRVWVMTVLSDDEALADHGRLPQGLRFHLSQCPSCRALADGLTSVTNALGLLADLEPSEALADHADRQTQLALKAGARLTGRVEVAEPPSSGERRSWYVGWPRVAGCAAAAVIGLSLGVAGLWSERQPAAETIAGGTGAEPRVRAARTAEPSQATPEDVLTPSRIAESPVEEKLARTEPAAAEADPSADPGASGAEVVASVPPSGASRKRSTSTEPGLLPGPPARTISSTANAPTCRHLTYLEAAQCEHGHTLDKPLILPKIEGRGAPKRQTVPRRFDNPAQTRSTVPRPPQRKGDRSGG